MTEKEFYDKVKNWDFSNFSIEEESFTNWDMYNILNEITNSNSTILDIGTGGGEKLLEKFPEVKEILGTDISPEMIKTANKNLVKSKRKNIYFRLMDNLAMNVPKNYYDVVVARNTIIDAKQIYQVLKKDGYLLVRGVDKYDCHELKLILGRGQAFNDKIPISIIDYENILKAGFRNVELVPIHVREYFKMRDNFEKFLLKVPIIYDFSEENSSHYHTTKLEKEKLDEYIKRNTYPKGIRLIRRYYGIVATK